MTTPLLGEFAGTLMLVLLGDGVVANVLLKRSKGEGSGWMVITSGWAFAVMAGVFVAIAFGSGDAHLNPAVTLGFAVSSGNFSKFAPYLLAQMLGAFSGAVLVWLHYLPHWRETPDPAAKLGCFCTAPAIRNTFANLASEITATFVLVLVAGAIFSKGVAAFGPAAGLAPYLVGSLVWGIGLSLGGTPAMPSIRRATSARAWHMPCFPLLASAAPIGAMRLSRSSDLSSAAPSQVSCCACFTFEFERRGKERRPVLPERIDTSSAAPRGGSLILCPG